MVVAYNAGLSAEVAGLREGLERIRDWAEEVAADREGRSVIDPDELVARITQSLSTKDTET